MGEHSPVKNIFLRIIAVCFFAVLLSFSGPASGQTSKTDDLRGKIDERNKAIADLEKEIASYQAEIDQVSKEANSLKNAIKNLDIERKKFETEIKVTENRIAAATLRIDELNLEIEGKENRIVRNNEAVAQAIKKMNAGDSESLPEIFLSENTLSMVLDRIETLDRFQASVRANTAETKALKAGLEEKERESEKQKKSLISLKAELADRKKIAEGNKREKDRLLMATKNKESNYKNILSQKMALKDAFEKELLDFEAQLKFELDPSTIPASGSGVLKWPLDSIKITQYFGNTDFANAHKALYNGMGHNGVDFRASIGTRVKSALGGTVMGAGDTDTVCPGASYGKWILIKHDNGLSTLYAHLSLIKASHGQRVETGEVIGYSGDTGYSTGPHLHFTVYASQGVQILSRKSKVCAGTYTMPIAGFSAYLNPLEYL